LVSAVHPDDEELPASGVDRDGLEPGVVDRGGTDRKVTLASGQ
jgi:hypothetical protein